MITFSFFHFGLSTHYFALWAIYLFFLKVSLFILCWALSRVPWFFNAGVPKHREWQSRCSRHWIISGKLRPTELPQRVPLTLKMLVFTSRVSWDLPSFILPKRSSDLGCDSPSGWKKHHQQMTCLKCWLISTPGTFPSFIWGIVRVSLQHPRLLVICLANALFYNGRDLFQSATRYSGTPE